MTGRVTLIVGASSGIGLATAERLASEGDRLVLAARSAESLDVAALACREAGATEVRTVVTNVDVEREVQSLIDTATDQHGRIDVVVHAATVMAYGAIETMPTEVFTQVVDTAIHGTVHVARAALAVFRRQHSGTLIIVNSLLGSVTVPQMGAYATAKWGQRAIARTLQQEVRDDKNIHVCIVSPGSTNTPIYYQAANSTGKEVRPPIPVLQPERVAASIASLARRPRDNVSIPVGPSNPFLVAGFRALPFVYDRIVGPLFSLTAQTRQALPATEGNVFKPDPGNEERHGHWPNPLR